MEEINDKPLKPKELMIAEAYVCAAGNVSETTRMLKAKGVSVSRQTITKIVERSDVRVEIVKQMEKRGIGAELIATKFDEGMNANTVVINNRTGEVLTVPDHKTRHLYIVTALKLNLVDLSGKSNVETTDKLDITDEELLRVLEAEKAKQETNAQDAEIISDRTGRTD